MYAMMPMRIQKFAVTTGPVLDELRHTRDGRGGGAGLLGHIAVTQTLRDQLCHFQSLAPRLEFAERAHIAQKIRDFLFGLARDERTAQRTEPRLLAVTIVGETHFCHCMRGRFT